MPDCGLSNVEESEYVIGPQGVIFDPFLANNSLVPVLGRNLFGPEQVKKILYSPLPQEAAVISQGQVRERPEDE